jgi:hypothetical protein
MKTYKITFTKDYAEYERITKQPDYEKGGYYEQTVKNNPGKVEFCKKWSGKEITILELEKLINEFGEVVFDGDTIEIYNDYRE